MKDPSSSRRHHASATIKISTESHRTLPVRADSAPAIDITPYAIKEKAKQANPKLHLQHPLCTREDRPPLPRHLQPTRPPKRRGRGAGAERATLNWEVNREKEEKQMRETHIPN
jgi:hypothetical protein